MIDRVFHRGGGKHAPHPPHPPRSAKALSAEADRAAPDRAVTPAAPLSLDVLRAQLANAEEYRIEALEEAECASEEISGYRRALQDAKADLRTERERARLADVALRTATDALAAACNQTTEDAARLTRLGSDLQLARSELDDLARALDGAGAPQAMRLVDRLRGLVAWLVVSPSVVPAAQVVPGSHVVPSVVSPAALQEVAR